MEGIREGGGMNTATKSLDGLTFSQRTDVFNRDWHRCQLCGRGRQEDVILRVARILSESEGRALGAPEAELVDVYNLFTCCEECHAGIGSHSLHPILALRLVRARLSRNGFTP